MYKIKDGYGKEHKANNFKISFNYDEKGKPKGEKLEIDGKVVYNGNKPIGVKKD